MILDTSAVVAVLYRESEAAAFAQLIHDAEVCRISVVSHVELSMVIEQQLGPDGMRQAGAFFRRAGVLIEPVTLDQGELARQAFLDFGKAPVWFAVLCGSHSRPSASFSIPSMSIYVYAERLWVSLSTAVHSSALVGWLGVFAELLVAAVIYWELARARRVHFVEEFQKTYWHRAKVYEAFVTDPDLSIEELILRFRERLDKDPELRSLCDEQIDHLNVLWHLQGRLQRKELTEWFPHVVTRLWIMLGPYVLDKSRLNGGLWADRNFVCFSKACITILCRREKVSLQIRSGVNVVTFDETFIHALRDGFRGLKD